MSVASPALRAIQLGAAPMLPRSWKLRISRGFGELTSARVHRQLARLVRGRGPIVAGPWLGEVGFEGQFHYSATGTVCNLASRLCDMALDGQILINQSVAVEVEHIVDLGQLEPLILKGILKPVTAFNVVRVLSHED